MGGDEVETAEVTAAAATTVSGNIIWVYVLIIAVIAFLPLIIDVIMAYKSRSRIGTLLAGKDGESKIGLDELKELIKEADKSPKGITGLYRATMAVVVIVILGIALFHLLITRSASDNQIIGNMLSMLGGLIAAIVGFYFGGRAVKEGEEAAKKKDGE